MIDVIIPVYNGEHFIVQALNSVVTQTLLPARIIVVDDGSTDNTEILVRSFNSKICIDYVQKSNGGLSSARNTGISRSSSDYVAFLDADDEWYPEKLEEQMRTFKESEMQNLGVVYCEYCIIDDKGTLTDNYYVFRFDPSIRGKIFESLLPANKISGSGSGVLVKRECFVRAGLFDERLSACEDWDMWLRMAKYYDFDFVPKELVKIRRHSGNMQKDKLHMFINQLKFYDKWISRLPDNANCFVEWRRLCMTHVVADFPRMAFLKAIEVGMSSENKRKLFGISFGSVHTYLFCSLPGILLGMLKHTLLQRFVTRTKY